MDLIHRRAHHRWNIPYQTSLALALVSGLSGAVAKLGSWAGQYGTSAAATLVADAQVGANGLALDGTGDYATCGRMASIEVGTGLISYSVWVKSVSNLDNIVFSKNYAGGVELYTYNQTGIFRLPGTYFGSASNNLYSTSATPNNNTWYHIAVTAAGSGGACKIYVNGSQVATANYTYNFNSTTDFLIGKRPALATLYNGYIDNLYCWPGVCLTQPEIDYIYRNDPYRRA